MNKKRYTRKINSSKTPVNDGGIDNFMMSSMQ
jgi:hypothetical protein